MVRDLHVKGGGVIVFLEAEQWVIFFWETKHLFSYITLHPAKYHVCVEVQSKICTHLPFKILVIGVGVQRKALYGI